MQNLFTVVLDDNTFVVIVDALARQIETKTAAVGGRLCCGLDVGRGVLYGIGFLYSVFCILVTFFHDIFDDGIEVYLEIGIPALCVNGIGIRIQIATIGLLPGIGNTVAIAIEVGHTGSFRGYIRPDLSQSR